MKKILLAHLLILSFHITWSQITDSVLIGVFNDQYIIFDETDLIFGKRLSEGLKGDTCLIFGYTKSSSGSIWLKVATIDTVGYAMADFIIYDQNKVRSLGKSKTVYNIPDYIKTNKADWIVNKEKIQQLRIEKRKKNQEDLKKFINKNELFIQSYSFPTTEYLKYPGFKVSIFNSNQTKTIKYIWFTVTAYNAVDDIEGTKKVECIGPVYPFKTADYSFETVFHSSVVDYSKITSIKILYMDGSIITFSKDQVESILVKSKVFMSYLDNSSL